MNVLAIMATCGRHHVCERSLRFFLDQDYEGPHTLLIYNNSDVPQRGLKISELSPEAMTYASWDKTVIVVNQHIDSKTGERYKTLGAIYNDILKDWVGDADVIVHWDDDDIFLPNHISEGVKGLNRAYGQDKIAYKPERSYYRHPNGIELMGNNLEPSVFVEAEHIKKYGYSDTTSDQHMPWFNALLTEHKILVDPSGPPTLIYNWGDVEIPTFKTSGNAGSPQNFDNYRKFSQNHGDRLITPWPKEDVKRYYDLVYAENPS